jgi:hypothetical protein
MDFRKELIERENAANQVFIGKRSAQPLDDD